MDFMKRIIIIRTISIGLLILFVIGCAGKQPKLNLTIEQRFNRGMEFFENEKYYNAQQEFQLVIISGSHTEYGDDAQFYLGESYFKNEEYILAIAEFERLTRNMKYSEYVEKARWRICESYVSESPKYYHDQENTRKAIQKLQEFIDEYPNSEYNDDAKDTIKKLRNKLAKKLNESGDLYIKLRTFDSAIITFKEVVNNYYDTKYAEKAHIGIIRSNILMKNFEEAKKYYDANNNKIVTEDGIKEVQDLLNSIESN